MTIDEVFGVLLRGSTKMRDRELVRCQSRFRLSYRTKDFHEQT